MPGTTRRQFTDDFKSEAVRLTRESGRQVTQVARTRYKGSATVLKIKLAE